MRHDLRQPGSRIVDLFEFLVRSLDEPQSRNAKLILAAAFREPRPDAPLAAALERLEADPGTHSHRVRGFDEATTYDFLQALDVPKPASSLVSGLQRWLVLKYSWKD